MAPPARAEAIPPAIRSEERFSRNAETDLVYRLPLALPYTPTRRSSDRRDGLIRVRNIRALNGRFNTSITHVYSIVIGNKHITFNATGRGFLTSSKQFRHDATSKSRRNTASNSTKHKSPHLSGWRQIISLITWFSETNPRHLVAVKLDQTMKPT